MKKNKLAGAVFTLLVSAQANAAYCPMYLNETVQPMFINATLAMNAEIVAMDTALSTLLKYQNEQLLSGLKVVTKQKSISSHQAADTERKAQSQ